EQLYQILTEFLVDDPNEVQLLLDTEQPLGSFGARIRAAYCLGLITRDAFERLGIIKSIRNRFAHRLHGLSFDDKEIQIDCDKLRKLAWTELPWNNRQVYLSSTMSAQNDLWATKQSILAAERRCKVPKWEVIFDSRRANVPSDEAKKK